MAERVAVRDITNEEGRKLLSIVRRGSGSVVRWRRAQIVLWSAQRMDVPAIAKIAFTSEDRVREVIHNFNADGFESLAAKYSGGRPPKFTLPERREIKKIALSRPVDHDLPFSTWSLSKLAEFLVAEGVVDDISHEGLRVLLREEGVSFQVIKTYKQSNDPDFEAKKNRVLELYEIADGLAKPKKGDPTVVICMDEFGPLNLLPRPGKQWAPRIVKGEGWQRTTTPTAPGHLHPHLGRASSDGRLRPEPGQDLRPRQGEEGPDDLPRVLSLPAHLVPAERPHRHRYGQLQPHLSTKVDSRVGDWAEANNVELAYVPTNASWMNRIEAQFQALRYFTLDGTDHRSHEEQNSMIRRYIIWRNRNAHDKTFREMVKRANVA